jgi:ATP-dependent DNA helicase RecG
MRAACNEIGQRQVHAEQNRNRRIGEFLKELDLTEGRSTGIPKILKVTAVNGSPTPLFETDDERASFVVRLPAHPLAKRTTTDVTVDVTTDVTVDVTTDVTVEVAALLQVIQGACPDQPCRRRWGSGMQNISAKHTWYRPWQRAT